MKRTQLSTLLTAGVFFLFAGNAANALSLSITSIETTSTAPLSNDQIIVTEEVVTDDVELSHKEAVHKAVAELKETDGNSAEHRDAVRNLVAAASAKASEHRRDGDHRPPLEALKVNVRQR